LPVRQGVSKDNHRAKNCEEFTGRGCDTTSQGAKLTHHQENEKLGEKKQNK